MKDWVGVHVGRNTCAWRTYYTVETEAKYNGYIKQQDRHIARLKEPTAEQSPRSSVYTDSWYLPGDPGEADRVRPATLGQAGRIPGVTPAAVAVLETYLRLSQRQRKDPSQVPRGTLKLLSALQLNFPPYGQSYRHCQPKGWRR